MAEVKLNAISKKFGSFEAIPNLSLVVPNQSFTVLVGPSGCGKSTLLRLIAGLESLSSGHIYIDGENVSHKEPSDRGIAMVFQSYALYPHMSVADNIGFGLKLSKKPKSEIQRRVKEAADILQLEALLERKPRELSGGQRQRVAIGRAIVRKPKVFLFDEPLSNLDAALRNQMRVELAELHEKLDATIIYVTHDQVEAMTMADQIVIMKSGVIQQVGSPMSLYHEPSNLFVAQFIGSPKMNLISGNVAEKRNADMIGIRPEHIKLSEQSGEWNAKIRHIEMLGAESIIYLENTDIGSISVRMTGDHPLSVGANVWLTPFDGKTHLFDGKVRRETV